MMRRGFSLAEMLVVCASVSIALTAILSMWSYHEEGAHAALWTSSAYREASTLQLRVAEDAAQSLSARCEDGTLLLRQRDGSDLRYEWNSETGVLRRVGEQSLVLLRDVAAMRCVREASLVTVSAELEQRGTDTPRRSTASIVALVGLSGSRP